MPAFIFVFSARGRYSTTLSYVVIRDVFIFFRLHLFSLSESWSGLVW